MQIRPSQNGYIERFNRSYREGVLDANILSTLPQAQEEIDIWIEDYNHPILMIGWEIKHP